MFRRPVVSFCCRVSLRCRRRRLSAEDGSRSRLFLSAAQTAPPNEYYRCSGFEQELVQETWRELTQLSAFAANPYRSAQTGGRAIGGKWFLGCGCWKVQGRIKAKNPPPVVARIGTNAELAAIQLDGSGLSAEGSSNARARQGSALVGSC